MSDRDLPPMAARNFLLDCGANTGRVLAQLLHRYPDHDAVAFEHNPECLPFLERCATLIPAAEIRTYDGERDLT